MERSVRPASCEREALVASCGPSCHSYSVRAREHGRACAALISPVAPRLCSLLHGDKQLSPCVSAACRRQSRGESFRGRRPPRRSRGAATRPESGPGSGVRAIAALGFLDAKSARSRRLPLLQRLAAFPSALALPSLLSTVCRVSDCELSAEKGGKEDSVADKACRPTHVSAYEWRPSIVDAQTATGQLSLRRPFGERPSQAHGPLARSVWLTFPVACHGRSRAIEPPELASASR